MARYLIEVGVTPESMGKLVGEPEDRAHAIRPLFEAFGGSLDEYYYAVGQATLYLIGEMPDEVSIQALTMVVLGAGAVTSVKFTAIVTSAEAMAAMERAAQVLRGPSS